MRAFVARMLPTLFCVLALPAVLMFALVTPPFQAPDEFGHYFYSRALAGGQLLPRDLGDGKVGGEITASDLKFAHAFSGISFHPERKATLFMFHLADEPQPGPPVKASFFGAAIYPPTAYLAPAIGLVVARAYGADNLHSLRAGRTANALMFVIVGAFAIALTPVAKPAFFLILLLPMTLSLAGSFSPDAQVIALSALICAILARAAQEPAPSIGSIVCSASLVIFIAVVKLPLIAMAIPVAALAWRRSRSLAIITAAVIATLVALWVVGFVLDKSITERDVSPSSQFAYLLSCPLSIGRIALNTLAHHGAFYFASAVGIFGWLDTPLPRAFYAVAAVAIVATGLATAAEEGRTKLRAPFSVAFVIAAALIFGALYLSWTPVGAGTVDGVQGRYFIPLLFPAVLALVGFVPTRPHPAFGIIPAIVLWQATVLYVPWVLILRFYLQ